MALRKDCCINRSQRHLLTQFSLTEEDECPESTSLRHACNVHSGDDDLRSTRFQIDRSCHLLLGFNYSLIPLSEMVLGLQNKMKANGYTDIVES